MPLLNIVCKENTFSISFNVYPSPFAINNFAIKFGANFPISTNSLTEYPAAFKSTTILEFKCIEFTASSNVNVVDNMVAIEYPLLYKS